MCSVAQSWLFLSYFIVQLWIRDGERKRQRQTQRNTDKTEGARESACRCAHNKIYFENAKFEILEKLLGCDLGGYKDYRKN